MRTTLNQTNSPEYGGRGGDRTALFICLSPPDSVHRGVLYATHRTSTESRLYPARATPTAGNGHATVATVPPRGLSHPRAPAHLSLLPAQRKSQCHLPSSGSGAFLFMSVHLGHSPSELIVLFLYHFICSFVFFKKRSFISCSATITSETESSCLPPAQHLAQTGLCIASLWPGC